ncbi:MAG: DUF4398 domain-containing protein [candidate division Zixibacteria bacterium]|nr:DUF4398 domain-containing protein [candidate division Zixibacteria bacterium]
MIKRVSSVLVALVVVGFAAGCSESPVVEFEASRAAIEDARVAEAEQYAPELFKEASDSLNAASVEMQRQDGRFATFRSYGQAESMILAARQIAEKAVVEAGAERELVRLADSTLIVEIETLIADTKQALAAAPKGKGSRLDLKVMQTDIDAAATALTAATEGYNAGSYLTTNEMLQTVKGQVTKVKSDIDAAVTRLTKK